MGRPRWFTIIVNRIDEWTSDYEIRSTDGQTLDTGRAATIHQLGAAISAYLRKAIDGKPDAELREKNYLMWCEISGREPGQHSPFGRIRVPEETENGGYDIPLTDVECTHYFSDIENVMERYAIAKRFIEEVDRRVSYLKSITAE